MSPYQGGLLADAEAGWREESPSVLLQHLGEIDGIRLYQQTRPSLKSLQEQGVAARLPVVRAALYEKPIFL